MTSQELQAQRLSQLHPELAKRYTRVKEEYAKLYPQHPQPFLVFTYRSKEEQQKLYNQGRTAKGKKVTNAQPGQSLHNYLPALAFDIAFIGEDKTKAIFDTRFFDLFAAIAKKYSLAWGGDWKSIKDKAHFEPPHFTWEQAAAGEHPVFPPLV